MCDQCQSPPTDRFEIPRRVEEYRQALETLAELDASKAILPARDREFAESLVSQFLTTGGLSPRQWEFVQRLAGSASSATPLQGSFSPIFVMFRLANTTGDMKQPRIRLMTEDGVFVQLNFDPEHPSEIRVFRDGWSGHGYRRYAGTIHEGFIVPYRDRFTPSMVAVINQLASDPLGTALAMAKLLSACMYCGSRLADEESKRRGYGPTCARNWHLPWGDRTNAPPSAETLDFIAELDSFLS